MMAGPKKLNLFILINHQSEKIISTAVFHIYGNAIISS